jgi:hypothetical protein
LVFFENLLPSFPSLFNQLLFINLLLLNKDRLLVLDLVSLRVGFDAMGDLAVWMFTGMRLGFPVSEIELRGLCESSIRTRRRMRPHEDKKDDHDRKPFMERTESRIVEQGIKQTGNAGKE